jgi:hypothetical protein
MICSPSTLTLWLVGWSAYGVQQAQLAQLRVELELAQHSAAELHDGLQAGFGMRHHLEDVGGRGQAPEHLADLGARLVEVGVGNAGHERAPGALVELCRCRGLPAVAMGVG